MLDGKLVATLKARRSLAKTVLLLLIINEVQGISRRWYEDPSNRYYHYRIFEKLPPSYSESESQDNAPVPASLRSSFDQQDTRKTFQYPGASSSRNSMESDIKFVFPDSTHESQKIAMKPAPSCDGSTFCEDVPNYPMHLVDEVLKDDQTIKNYQNVDVVDNIAQRIDITDSEPLCTSTEGIVFPKSAESMNNKWEYIVNNNNFTQGVRIETCRDVGNSCRMVEGFAEGYKTSCEQKYTYRQLTALFTDGKIGRDYFRFPTACCCHIEFVGTQTRFGSVPVPFLGRSKPFP